MQRRGASACSKVVLKEQFDPRRRRLVDGVPPATSLRLVSFSCTRIRRSPGKFVCDAHRVVGEPSSLTRFDIRRALRKRTREAGRDVPCAAVGRDVDRNRRARPARHRLTLSTTLRRFLE